MRHLTLYRVTFTQNDSTIFCLFLTHADAVEYGYSHTTDKTSVIVEISAVPYPTEWEKT
jgi:hypothetical protein